MTNIPKSAPRQREWVTRRVGDQLYLLLWSEEGREVWASLCAACGIEPFLYVSEEKRAFTPSRRCPTHAARGVPVRSVVRLIKDSEMLELFAAARTQVEKLDLGERIERLPRVAAGLLRARIESGTVSPPGSYAGSGWCCPVGDGFFQVCGICGLMSVVLNNPREDPAWPLVRCRKCRKSNARVPSPFALMLTSRAKTIFDAAYDAMQQEEEVLGSSLPSAKREAFTRNVRLAKKILRIRLQRGSEL